MADDQPIGADDVARKQFNTAFRGFDQYEVRAFLAQIAAELASLHERERSLREKLAAVEERPAPRHVPEDELEAALGAETTRVLHAAREAAAEIRSRAEESVARLLREANDEAARMRSEAETVLSRRTEEAEGAASAILASAEEAAARLRADAEAAATAAVEEAQRQGKEMLAEAQAVRERVLKDLARRRKAAATQVEQLLAGRERLLAAYDTVRTTLDQATGELTAAEAEARQAAEAAGLRGSAEETVPAGEPAPEPEPAPAGAEAPLEPPPDPDVLDVSEGPVVDTVQDPAPVDVRPVAIVPRLPDDEPGPAPATDDRRSSSLRLLRRKADPELPPLADDVEGVRIIHPGEDAAPAPVPRPVAVPDVPEPEVADAPDVQGVDVIADPLPAEDAGDKPVDDLFARLRADRAAAVARAEAVLADDDGAGTEEPAAEAAVEPEVAAESEVAAEPVADGIFEARDAAVEPIERALTRTLKRALADEQNEVLDTLRRLRGTPTIEVLLPPVDDHVARYAGAAARHLRDAAEAGAAGAAAPPVDEPAAALGHDVAGDLRARLERTLDATSGDDEALTEAVSATYREWKASRSEPLARHHVAAAYALGSFVATAASELRWVVDPAEGGCPDCDDNALAGPTPTGQAFPTGQVHPPAHAGCRCLVLPAS